MRAVIISPFFFPEPISTGKYNGLLASGLIEHGISVKVICSHPLYPSWIPTRTDENLPGVMAVRGGAWLRYPASVLLRRAILELWFTIHAFSSLAQRHQHASVVIPVFPPSLFMVFIPWILKKRSRVVGIVHDLQGIYAERKSGILGRLLQAVIAGVEGRAFHACHHLVFLSRSMRDVAVATYGLDINKTSVHYPFVTLPNETSSVSDSRLNVIFNDASPCLVYSGALGEKQAPNELVALMIAILDRYPAWQAKIFSQGPVFDALLQSHYHSRLKFLPLVDTDLLPALLERSDVQIVPQAEDTSSGSLPSKVPNIIASGTRLLCITDRGSELAQLIEEYEAGVVVTTWDQETCLIAFDKLIQKPKLNFSTAKLLNQFTLNGLIKSILRESTNI